MGTPVLNHLLLPELAIAEGATSPDPGGKSVVWSTTASKYLGWNGTSWEALGTSGTLTYLDPAVVQTTHDEGASGTDCVLTFGADVTEGNVIIVTASSFVATGNTPSAFVTGDLTKTGGTATIGSLAVDVQSARTATSEERTAIYSMVVTATGSLELTLDAGTGDFLNAVALEVENLDTAALLEDTTTANGAGSGGSLLMSAGSMSSDGKGIMIGVFGAYTSGTSTWSRDGAFTAPSGAEVGDSAYNASSTIYRLLTGATTDAPEATNSDVQTPGWAAAGAVYKAATTGGGGGGGSGLTQPQVLARGLGA